LFKVISLTQKDSFDHLIDLLQLFSRNSNFKADKTAV